MKLQYYTSIYTDTEDVLHLLANKKEISKVPFDTECQKIDIICEWSNIACPTKV